MISHNPSQADYLDGGLQTDMFPPPPAVTSNQGNSGTYDHMMRGGNAQTSSPMDYGPMPANALLGGSLF
jgi:hypothetical protein